MSQGGEDNKITNQDPLGLTPKQRTPYTPPKNTIPVKKKASGSVKILWVLFFIVVAAMQFGSPLLLDFDFADTEQGDAVEAFFDNLPEFLKDNFLYFSIALFSPAWYFGIKYRHSKIMWIIMGVVIAPPAIIVGFYILIALIILAVFAAAAAIAFGIGNISKGSRRREKQGMSKEAFDQLAERDAARHAGKKWP